MLNNAVSLIKIKIQENKLKAYKLKSEANETYVSR